MVFQVVYHPYHPFMEHHQARAWLLQETNPLEAYRNQKEEACPHWKNGDLLGNIYYKY